MQKYNIQYSRSINNFNKCGSFFQSKILSRKFLNKKNIIKNNLYINKTLMLLEKYKIFSTYLPKIRLRKIVKEKRIYFAKKKLDITPVINLLKVPSKFQYISEKFFNYCRVYFKFTGSNIFLTITDNRGDVKFSYSSGIFKGVKIRKERVTVFVSRQLGQLACVRLYKSNARSISLIPLINHRRTRVLLKFLLKGFRFIRLVKIKHIFMKVKVMRNGIRLKKVPRK